MDISQEFIRKVMLGIKYDTKRTLSENKKTILKEEDSNQCKDDWYWYAEEGTDNRYEKGIKCWDGKDPLSCKLRKFLGETLNAGISFCRNMDTIIPCSDGLSYKNACAIGRQGNNVVNPRMSNKRVSWNRNENYVVDPMSPNSSNLSVEVFTERKELISLLDGLLGVKNRKLSGARGTLIDNHFRQGNKDGCYEWLVENVSDDTVISVLNTLKNQTSIPFGGVEEGEINVQYVENGVGKETQTISSKIINTVNIETGKKYNFKEVQSDFGVKSYNKQEPKDSTTNKENFNDNLKLNKAWESGWRPNNGMEVPENLQTNTYKNSKSTNIDGNIEGNGDNDGHNDNKSDGNNEEDFIPSVDEIPGLKNAEFVGDFYEWFNNNFIYPIEAEKNSIEGTVNVTFTIDIDGAITNIVTDNNSNKILSDEVVILIKKMPKWAPAEIDGKKISSKVTIPVEFSLGII
jgi:TonB family protein